MTRATGKCADAAWTTADTLKHGQVCSIHLTDTFGDGWNGAYFQIAYETTWGDSPQRWQGMSHTLETGGSATYTEMVAVPDFPLPPLPPISVTGAGCKLDDSSSSCIVHMGWPDKYSPSAQCTVTFGTSNSLKVLHFDLEQGAARPPSPRRRAALTSHTRRAQVMTRSW